MPRPNRSASSLGLKEITVGFSGSGAVTAGMSSSERSDRRSSLSGNVSWGEPRDTQMWTNISLFPPSNSTDEAACWQRREHCRPAVYLYNLGGVRGLRFKVRVIHDERQHLLGHRGFWVCVRVLRPRGTLLLVLGSGRLLHCCWGQRKEDGGVACALRGFRPRLWFGERWCSSGTGSHSWKGQEVPARRLIDTFVLFLIHFKGFDYIFSIRFVCFHKTNWIHRSSVGIPAWWSGIGSQTTQNAGTSVLASTL